MANTNTTITAGQVAPAVVNLGSTSPVSVNASMGNDFRITLSADTTINMPGNGVDGQRITIQVAQPSSGGPFTVTWGSGFNFGAAGAPALSTAAQAVDVIGFIYNQSIGDWLGVGTALGF